MLTREARRAIKNVLLTAPPQLRDRPGRIALRQYERYLGFRQSRVEGVIVDQGMPLPPARLRVTVVGYPSPADFLETGERDNQTLRDTLERNGKPVAELAKILDWGCGCGRLTRWWNDVETAEVHGCDYNPMLVRWVAENLPFVHATTNKLTPPLPYAAGSFDFIYAISVFTHLDDGLSRAWLAEIRRVLRPGGMFFFTAHGVLHRDRLNEVDAQAFDSGKMVVHFASIGGTNLCSSYQPRSWLETAIQDAGLDLVEVVETHSLSDEQRRHQAQDRYLVRLPG